MRLLRLLTAGAVIGGAIVLVKRLMEQQAEGPGASGPAEPGAAPTAKPRAGAEGAGASSGGRTTGGGAAGGSASNGGEATKAELYERAQELGIEGRSKMSKRELQRAIESAG